MADFQRETPAPALPARAPAPSHAPPSPAGGTSRARTALRQQLRKVGYQEGRQLLHPMPVSRGGPGGGAAGPKATHPGKPSKGARPGALAQKSLAKKVARLASPDAIAQDAMKTGGREVPHAGQMEKAFGRSFANVRAHTGPDAAQASKSLGAKAFAKGDHVAFKDAKPDVRTIAHELAHVAQQTGALQKKPEGAIGGDAYEREADAVADVVAAGGKVAPGQMTGDTGVRLRRQPEGESWDEGGGGAEGSGPGEEPSYEDEPTYEETPPGEGGAETGGGEAGQVEEDPSTWPSLNELRPDLQSREDANTQQMDKPASDISTLQTMARRTMGVPHDPRVQELVQLLDAAQQESVSIQGVLWSKVSPDDQATPSNVEARLDALDGDVAFLQLKLSDYQRYIEQRKSACSISEARVIAGQVKGIEAEVQTAEYSVKFEAKILAGYERGLADAEFMMKLNLAKNAVTALIGVTPLGIVSTGVGLFDMGMSLMDAAESGSAPDAPSTVNNAGGLVGGLSELAGQAGKVMDACGKSASGLGGLISFIDQATTDQAEVRRLQREVREHAAILAGANSRLSDAMTRFTDAVARGKALFAQASQGCRKQEGSVETF